MTYTHVIILAQGQQKRLPDLKTPKQLLELPACGGASILERTLYQLAMLGTPMGMDSSCSPDCDLADHYVSNHVTVVCAHPIRYQIEAGQAWSVLRKTGKKLHLDAHELGDPGNSSLKGIAKYLDEQDYLDTVEPNTDPQTVVLFGDTVYSWACLRACLAPTHWNMGFVGTRDLSRSGGELWGLMWTLPSRGPMMDALGMALVKHPPFDDTYQPGQMRRWLWAIDELIDGPLATKLHYTTKDRTERTWYTAIDDYTRDIDLPEHVAAIGALSEHAAADDAANGLYWEARNG